MVSALRYAPSKTPVGGAAVITPVPNDLLSCEVNAGDDYWIEPGTREAYPIAYHAYRRKRESQERMPARHRGLGPDIDHYVWRRCLTAASDVDIVFAVRPGAPPRIQRIVAEVLCGIRRGRTASEAIRRVARRFGLRHGRARAFITAGITLERQARDDIPMSCGTRTGP
jgi:hypothetical protein